MIQASVASGGASARAKRCGVRCATTFGRISPSSKMPIEAITAAMVNGSAEPLGKIAAISEPAVSEAAMLKKLLRIRMVIRVSVGPVQQP